MATVQVFTKARMFAIEQAAFIAARLEAYNLILTRKSGEDVDLGNVRGATGSTGLTPTLRGTSTTSQALTIASKVFAVTGLNVAFPIGATVKAQGAISTNYMVGLVTASTTTSVTLNVLEISGSGTFASWTLTIGALLGNESRGSTARRDAIHGSPTTAAARVALANAQPVWFNTDLGWEESYYATLGLSGLTVTPLVPDAPSGWYPTGPGPKAVLMLFGTQSLVTGARFTNWKDWNDPAFAPNLRSWKNTPGNTFGNIFDRPSGSAYLRTGMGGRYRITFSMLTHAHNATLGLEIIHPTEGTIQRRWLVLPSGVNTVGEFSNSLLVSGDHVSVINRTGSPSPIVIGGDGEDFLSIEYLGPPLMSIA